MIDDTDDVAKWAYTSLREHWTLSLPYHIRPLAQGTNNRVLLVGTPAGSYILRISSNHADLDRLRFEQRVLTFLQSARLSFAVPTPIQTTEGATYVGLNLGGENTLATLTTLIPGEHPQGDNLQQAIAAGEALAQMDVALAEIVADNGEGISWRSYGDLEHCHPLVPDPLGAFHELPMHETAKQRLERDYTWLLERIPNVYARLPQQLIHEDYAPSNVLVQKEHVTGVLDFEFCSRDIRIMDLTVALSWWPNGLFGKGAEWPIIGALAQGYARHITLTDEEIVAIPLLYQLRAYTSLIHRLGRYRQGVSSLDDVLERAYAALEREDWLAKHGARLTQVVREMSGPR